MRISRAVAAFVAVVVLAVVSSSCVKNEIPREYDSFIHAVPADGYVDGTVVLLDEVRDFSVIKTGDGFNILLCQCDGVLHMAASNANPVYDASEKDPSSVKYYRYLFPAGKEAGLKHEFWFFNPVE